MELIPFLQMIKKQSFASKYALINKVTANSNFELKQTYDAEVWTTNDKPPSTQQKQQQQQQQGKRILMGASKFQAYDFEFKCKMDLMLFYEHTSYTTATPHHTLTEKAAMAEIPIDYRDEDPVTLTTDPTALLITCRSQ